MNPTISLKKIVTLEKLSACTGFPVFSSSAIDLLKQKQTTSRSSKTLLSDEHSRRSAYIMKAQESRPRFQGSPLPQWTGRRMTKFDY